MKDLDRLARGIAAEAEREYRVWERAHPQATTLEKLYRIYGDGNRILRKVTNGGG